MNKIKKKIKKLNIPTPTPFHAYFQALNGVSMRLFGLRMKLQDLLIYSSKAVVPNEGGIATGGC